jgi:hypothetical protein
MFRNIITLELTHNKKGDVFCRSMSDLFHALGYNEPRFDVQKAGREIDLETRHRIENKIAFAECKAHKTPIGGRDINKFVGALHVEESKFKKQAECQQVDIIGYFISLSGYTETAIEQEKERSDKKIILLQPKQIIDELISGKIIVPLEVAVCAVIIKGGFGLSIIVMVKKQQM